MVVVLRLLLDHDNLVRLMMVVVGRHYCRLVARCFDNSIVRGSWLFGSAAAHDDGD
jgi:hypothetical protein